MLITVKRIWRQWAGNLREAREAAGLTQAQLAKRIGASQPSVARWESGDGGPSDRYKIAIGKALGWHPHDLFPLEDV